MTYELEFLPSALKEWRKLGDTIGQQFKKKLKERLQRPRIQAMHFTGCPTASRSNSAPPVADWCTGSKTNALPWW